MKNVLVATDLSPSADRAVRRALCLAEHVGAKLTLLHAVDSSLPAGLVAVHKRKAAEILEEDAGLGPRHVAVTTQVVSGDPWAVILESAARTKADLVVVGKHHKKKWRDMFVGTTSERVIRNLDVPVLVAVGPHRQHYRNVVAGVDFSVASKRALQTALALNPRGKVTAVHAYEVLLPAMASMSVRDATRVRQTVFAERADRAGAELQVWLGHTKHAGARRIHRVIANGTPVHCLQAAVRRTRAELLAVGTRGLGAMGRLLTGSVSAALLNDPPCDLLVTSSRSS